MLLFPATIIAPTRAAIFTVTSTNNSGAGTFRQAITDANLTAALDTIRFNILPAGNLFETSGLNSYAVIVLTSSLPTISQPVLIDGLTQPNTNLGAYAGFVVGVDAFTQANISYPDVWITRSYALPSNSTGVVGNGLTINSANVTVRGLCISGFGNTSTDGGTASGHSDISVIRSSAARNVNVTINNCFLSCTPRGTFPVAARRTRGNGLLICGNNNQGTIENNLFAYCGTYGIHFNGAVDNLSVGPSSNLAITNYLIEENILLELSSNTAIATNRTADAINTMHCSFLNIRYNYISNVEQVGIDLGWNADRNIVQNNTLTGFTKLGANAPQCGIRVALSSQYDTVYRNVIYNNGGTQFLSGIWLDRSSVSTAGIVMRDNMYNRIEENHIYNNNGNGITMSTFIGGGAVTATQNVFTRNSIYNNTGLGIDLNFINTTGPVQVNPNDNGDVDAGLNNLQNFPMIDSVVKYSASEILIYGKAPAGSTIEFYISDGGVNQHGGFTLNYGEGRTYIGSGEEGSVLDLRTGTGSYAIDGNTAVNNVNMYCFYFNNGVSALLNPATDRLTSTATISNNTSEFGPQVTIMNALGCQFLSLIASRDGEKVNLNWQALCDPRFQGFEVQRCVDGIQFNTISPLFSSKGAGAHAYSYTDLLPASGINYYRIKMNDANGQVRYSQIVRVQIQAVAKSSALNVSSFFNSRMDFEYNSTKDEVASIQLFNNMGMLMRSQTASLSKGTNYGSLEQLANLSPGVYILVVRTNDGTTESERVIKK